MGFTFDYFVASMRCTKCGVVSPADESTKMTTHVRDEPSLARLGVGAPVVLPAEMEELGYYTVKRPAAGEAVNLLQKWRCPTCRFAGNWAEIAIESGAIARIEAIAAIDRARLAKAHFITNDCIDLAAELTGRSYEELVDENVVEILKRALK